MRLAERVAVITGAASGIGRATFELFIAEGARVVAVDRDAEGLAAFVAEVRAACPPNVRLVELEAHINDPAFSEAALAVVDGWLARGVLPKG